MIMTSPSRGTICPSFASTLSLQRRRSRECRVRAAPAVSCARLHKGMRTRACRFSGGNPAFPAQWLDGLCRALPGDEFVLSPSLNGLTAKSRPVGPASPPLSLTSATDARTTRFCRTQQRRSSCARVLAHEFSKEPPCDHLARRRCRVHRILSRVRDDRQRPSCRERTGRAGSADLPDGLSEIFLAGWLDRFWLRALICPSGAFSSPSR